jgi:hypothetical protein
MARFDGLFYMFRTISKAFKKKRRFDNELHKFRRRLPIPVKNSTAQNWHKAAQKLWRETGFVHQLNRTPRRRRECAADIAL